MTTTTIRTIRARSAAEALRRVRDELGAGAVILHTRTYKSGGFFGLRAKSWTEITASAAAKPAAPAPSPAPPRPPAPIVPQATARKPQAPQQLIDLKPQPAPQASSRKPQAAPAPAASRAPQAAEPSSLRDEMATIKRLVGQVLRSANGHAAPAIPDALFEHYLTLIQSEVAAELADQVVAGVRDELKATELAQPEVVRAAVLKRLAAYIPVAEQRMPAAPRTDGRPLTIALIGPTGVGKTTTVAKLAATMKLREGRKIGLITCDTFRIAAVDQLRTYAEIIGLPLKVVMTPSDMREACAAMRGMDAVLIDTAGRSPSDAARLEELSAILAAAEPHETHLVLSSTASESVLRDAAARFEPLAPSRVIFTKLDEAVNFGVLVNTARRLGAKLSFVTTGQEVPDQIEAGDSTRLASLIMQGRDALANGASR